MSVVDTPVTPEQKVLMDKMVGDIPPRGAGVKLTKNEAAVPPVAETPAPQKHETIKPVESPKGFDLESAHQQMQKHGIAKHGDVNVRAIPSGDGYRVEVHTKNPSGGAIRETMSHEHMSIDDAQKAAISELQRRSTSGEKLLPDIKPPGFVKHGHDDASISEINTRIAEKQSHLGRLNEDIMKIKASKSKAGLASLEKTKAKFEADINEEQKRLYHAEREIHAQSEVHPLEKYAAAAKIDAEQRAEHKMRGGLTEAQLVENMHPHMEAEISKRHPDLSPEVKAEAAKMASSDLARSPMRGIDKAISGSVKHAESNVAKASALKEIDSLSNYSGKASTRRLIESSYDKAEIKKHLDAAKTEAAKHDSVEKKAKRFAAEEKETAERRSSIAHDIAEGKPVMASDDDMRAIARGASRSHTEWHSDHEMPKPMTTKDLIGEMNDSQRMAPKFADAFANHGIYTNSKFAMLAPDKLKSAYPKADAYPGTEKGIVGYVRDQFKEKTGGAAKVVAGRVSYGPKSRTDVSLVRDPEGNSLEVNSRYISTIKAQYPDATFHISKSEKLVAKSDGKPVAIVMPMEATGKHAESYAPRLKPSDILQPGPHKEFEFTKTDAFVKGHPEIRVSIKDRKVNGVEVATAAEAKQKAIELLSHAHGVDKTGELVFKPKSGRELPEPKAASLVNPMAEKLDEARAKVADLHSKIKKGAPSKTVSGYAMNISKLRSFIHDNLHHDKSMARYDSMPVNDAVRALATERKSVISEYNKAAATGTAGPLGERKNLIEAKLRQLTGSSNESDWVAERKPDEKFIKDMVEQAKSADEKGDLGGQDLGKVFGIDLSKTDARAPKAATGQAVEKKSKPVKQVSFLGSPDAESITHRLANSAMDQQAKNGFVSGGLEFGDKYSKLSDKDKMLVIKGLASRGLVSPAMARKKNPPIGREVFDEVSAMSKRIVEDHKMIATNRHIPVQESAEYSRAIDGPPPSTEPTPSQINKLFKKSGPDQPAGEPIIAHPQKPTDLISLIRQVESGADNGALISSRELRKHSGMGKEEFDNHVLKLAAEGKIMMHRHDYPAGLTDKELAELVKGPEGRYFVGMALRRNTPEPKEFTTKLIPKAGKPTLDRGIDKK